MWSQAIATYSYLDYKPLTHITEQANIYILKVQQQLPLKPVYQLSQKYYLPRDKKIAWLDQQSI